MLYIIAPFHCFQDQVLEKEYSVYMASRNSRKLYLEREHYHVYNRGVNKRKIFQDNEDYATFLNLFKRYLSRAPAKDKRDREYPWLYNGIELLAFCLMPNHFHLLVFQLKEDSLKQLMKNVCGTYTTYFNKKYKRVGPLFQDRFKAVLISSDEYLHHISRYIHMNPKNYKDWDYSSIKYYLGSHNAEWVQPSRIMELFENPKEYELFLTDYEEQKEILEIIKSDLADR